MRTVPDLHRVRLHAGGLLTTLIVPRMTKRWLILLNRRHELGRILRELDTALLKGIQEPKVPITTGSVGPRCPYLGNLRSNPTFRDFGASNGIVKSMMTWDVDNIRAEGCIWKQLVDTYREFFRNCVMAAANFWQVDSTMGDHMRCGLWVRLAPAVSLVRSRNSRYTE